MTSTTGGTFSTPDDQQVPDMALWLGDLAQQVEDEGVSDTGVVDLLAGLTVQPGWSVSTCTGRIKNGIAQVHLAFSRSGANLPAAANGNVANVDIALLPDGWHPAIPVPAGITSSGFILGAFVWSSGMVGFGATMPNIPVNTGDGFTLASVFPV